MEIADVSVAQFDAASMDSESLVAAFRVELMKAHEFKSQDLKEAIAEQRRRNELAKQGVDYVNLFSESSRASKGIMVDEPTWAVEGNQKIHLDNGYVLEFKNQRQEWTITDNNGNTSRIWGDPHVDEDGNGSTDWDFKHESTFILKDGTKISVGVELSANGNVSFSDTLTITKGNQYIEVTGIRDNRVQIGDVRTDGLAQGIDANTNDGHVFKEGNNGVGDWLDANNSEIHSNQAWTALDNEVAGVEATIPGLTQEQIDYLDSNRISHDFNAGDRLTPSQWEGLKEKINGFKDGITSQSQLEMIQLQSDMNKVNQLTEMMSNLEAKRHQSTGTLVGNLR